MWLLFVCFLFTTPPWHFEAVLGLKKWSQKISAIKSRFMYHASSPLPPHSQTYTFAWQSFCKGWFRDGEHGVSSEKQMSKLTHTAHFPAPHRCHCPENLGELGYGNQIWICTLELWQSNHMPALLSSKTAHSKWREGGNSLAQHQHFVLDEFSKLLRWFWRAVKAENSVTEHRLDCRPLGTGLGLWCLYL